MAKHNAFDLSEKQYQQNLLEVSLEENSVLRNLVLGQEVNLANKSLQIAILEKQKETLQISWEAEKRKKPKDRLLAKLAGAFGIGYFIGNLTN